MISITSILSVGQETAKVTLSDGSVLLVPKKLIYDRALRKNDPVDEATIDELITESETAKIVTAALRLLAHRMHSRGELFQKLMAKKLDKNFIPAALNRLIESGMIDDRQFAEQYTAEMFFHKKQGKRKIEYALLKKGVSADTIKRVLNTIITEDESLDNALVLAKKKLHHYSARIDDPQQIQHKLRQYLLSKGFSFDIIGKVIAHLNVKTDEYEQGFS